LKIGERKRRALRGTGGFSTGENARPKPCQPNCRTNRRRDAIGTVNYTTISLVASRRKQNQPGRRSVGLMRWFG
jgi:hypothetical protein